MTPLDALIADALLAHAINLLRLEAGYQAEVEALLVAMEGELVAKLSAPSRLSALARERLEALLDDARATIKARYSDIADTVDPLPLAQLESSFVRATLAEAVGVRLVAAVPPEAVLRALTSNVLIQGGPATDWWAKQGDDAAFRFSNAVRQGVAQGETNAQIIARVRGGTLNDGPLATSKRDAAALVRTSVQTVTNKAREVSYEANADILRGVQQVSTLDSRTTVICVAYSGAEWEIPSYKPIPPTKLPYNGGCPRHWSCRSIIVPRTKPLIEGLPGFEPSERASIDGPIAADTTFTQWLSKKPKDFQDDLLGTGRAELYREGKITLPQLLDQRGRPLSLEQLRAKYDK